MKSLNFLAVATLLSACISAQAIEPCMASAAKEFAVPANVLDAMRREERAPLSPAMAAREFGPMGLGEPVLLAAKAGAGIEPDRAKLDPCENYRAAAWFLADARKRSGGDLWKAVKLYRGGQEAGATEYVRRIQIASQSK